jgi:hypothetical protein
LLNPDEFERTDVVVIVFQAKLNDFTHTFHEGVEPLGLGVTTAKGGNRGDVVAFFVLLDQYGKFSFWLQVGNPLKGKFITKWQSQLGTSGLSKLAPTRLG